MDIGLVLSGGMAKGAFQIGALRAISKYIPPEDIKYISAASGGVLNAYAFATGNLDAAEDMWKNICTEDSRFLIGQILRSSMLQNNISLISAPEKVLGCKLYCSLLDATNKRIVYRNISSLEPKDISRYLKASVAMPVYNRGVVIDGVSYYDGAMIDNIPVFPLMKHKLDYIICIYFDDTCYKFENSYFDNKIIKLTCPINNGLKDSLVFNRESIGRMIKCGYDVTNQMFKSIMSRGHDDIEHIYGAIEHINSKNTNSRLRLTGDVLVTNMNKIAQRLAKKKIMK